MAARAKADQADVPTEENEVQAVAVDAQGNPLPEAPAEPAESGPFTDVLDTDLTDPVTGKPAPVSATTEDLQGTLASVNGRPLVKVAVRGYIGEEPVVVLAAHAGQFALLVDALAEALQAQKSAFAGSAPAEPAETSE